MKKLWNSILQWKRNLHNSANQAAYALLGIFILFAGLAGFDLLFDKITGNENNIIGFIVGLLILGSAYVWIFVVKPKK